MITSVNIGGVQVLMTAEMGLSPRTDDKVLPIARTIADLDSPAEIWTIHMIEAVNYRMLDRQL